MPSAEPDAEPGASGPEFPDDPPPEGDRAARSDAGTGASGGPGDGGPTEIPAEAPFVVVEVVSLGVDLPAPHAVVVLGEVAEPHRSVAIPVALADANALAHAWRGEPTSRPLSHEMFAEVLARLGVTIEVVRVIGRRAGVFLAEIELSGPRGRERVPCRPTDGLTLAYRQLVRAPILLDAALFEPEGDVDPDRDRGGGFSPPG
jgi:bifunctional DNase/RNase